MTLLDLLDRPIAFHRPFVSLTGSINAALMLSQAFYWSKRTKDADGWFWKSRGEWTDETGLTHEQQEVARKKLSRLPIWEERHDRENHRIYFRINEAELRKLLREEVGANRETRRGVTVKHGEGEPSNAVSYSKTETTLTETTYRDGFAIVSKADSKDVSKEPKASAQHQEFMEEWNNLPPSIPPMKMMTDKRRKAFNARAKLEWWRDNWREALRMLADSPFAKGVNNRGWTANPEWFLKPDSVAMILEGKYADKTPKKTEDPDFWRKHL